MEYTHISDCWDAIREAKSPEEIEKLFDDFPVKMGSWFICKNGDHYTIENTYKQYGDMQTDAEDFYFEESGLQEDE